MAMITAAMITVAALGLGVAATALPFHGVLNLPSGWGGQGLDSPLRISTVLALSQDRLPIPTEPRTIDADGVWLYDATRDEVVASDTSTRGLSYVITIDPRDLSADGLRADTVGRPAEVRALLTVPATEHEADIRALAQQVTAGVTTTYDQAIALQTFLRNAQNFSYDTRLGPPRRR